MKRKRGEAGRVRIGVVGRREGEWFCMRIVPNYDVALERRGGRYMGRENKEGNTNPSWILASRPPSMLVT